MNSAILDVFSAHRGIVSVVGAGGKKSTIFRLAAAHPGRIGLTSTVLTPPFRQRLNAHPVVCAPDELYAQVAEAAVDHDRVAYACTSSKPARLGGVPAVEVSRIHHALGFEATFVKADGARLRWIKAPDRNEPAVPEDTDVLIPVASIRAIGKPLTDEIAHRAREVARIMKINIGDRVTAAHLARLLSSDEGALKSAGTAKVIVVINMVEAKEQMRLGRLVAEQVLAQSDRVSRVVIASMAREAPVLAVIDG